MKTALLEQPATTASGRAPTRAEDNISVTVTSRIEAVEMVWRALSASGMESPGQSYDFIALWVKNRAIAVRDQVYIVGSVDGVPVALLPLHRRRSRGIRLYSWFAGSNVGCCAPVVDHGRLDALGASGRKALWARMTAPLIGADLIYLRSIPSIAGGYPGLFDELGAMLRVDTLHRAQFSSWTECDRVQRSKSRRKHDRQQGERLDGLGTVSFEEIHNGGEARGIIDTMFHQRSARFKTMGVRDIFVCDGLTSFYHAAIGRDSGIDVRLHVLRLNGAIVAVRYNIVEGERMFCLISSMSDDVAIQHGSPGKQCLLRVMQSVFDQGFSVFDMGAGLTDEKRHWCNMQKPLRHHYVPISLRGRGVLAVHRAWQQGRARIKANKKLVAALRAPGQWLHRGKGGAADAI